MQRVRLWQENCVNAGQAMQRLSVTLTYHWLGNHNSLMVVGDGANCIPIAACAFPHTDKTDLVSKNTLDKPE